MSDDQNAAVYNYLRAKGVSAFWADSAMGYIRRGMNTNNYFTVDVAHQSATVEGDMLTRYSATIMAHFPDCEGRPQSKALRLVYTMDPKRKLSHQVKVGPWKPQ